MHWYDGHDNLRCSARTFGVEKAKQRVNDNNIVIYASQIIKDSLQ